MAALLPAAIPDESEATCDDCAMLPPAGEPGDSPPYFSPATKCCTYHPNLPNFTVGRVLLDDDPAGDIGRTALETRLREGHGVSPLGVAQPPPYQVLYRHSAEAFGRSTALRCPYYIVEGGRCGVWRHRDAVCTTWFCKYVRGAVGLAFWSALRALLVSVESALARHCVLELELGTPALRALVSAPPTSSSNELSAAQLDGRREPSVTEGSFGSWQGRERGFFIRCARIVEKLGWDDVLRIAGPDVRIRAQIVAEAFDALRSDNVPARLDAGSFQIAHLAPDVARIWAYDNPFDPLDLPRPVLELLPYFDGRPTRDAVAAIAAERGVRLGPAVIRKLVDFEVLLPAEALIRRTTPRAGRRPGST